MKRLLIISTVFLLSHLSLLAQSDCDIFRAYLINKEYDVFLKIDLCDESINVPGQELYGSLPGYFGKRTNSFCWVITSAEIQGNKAILTMINDFGSEDLKASLTQNISYTEKRFCLYLASRRRKYLKNGTRRKMAKDA